ncbi:MAG: NAD-dependent epimerase/dehydratase family protein [Haloferacaceae archaeon]
MADRVLVTGSSGVIGTALAERLIDDGADVTGVDRNPNPWSVAVDEATIRADLCDPGLVEDLPVDVDIVVHLAARSRVPDLVEDPAGARENLDSTHTVLEYARRTGADLLFASSREVYGEQDRVRSHESDAGVRSPVNPYGASKVAGEAMATAYDECYDVRTASLRFSNVYGRYDASDRVVPTFVARARRGEDLTVYGDDKVLDFLHVDDCVDAVVAALEAFGTVHGTALNVGAGRGRSIVELAETVRAAVGSDSAVVVEPDRTGEVSRFVPATDAIEALLGWTPDVNFEAGIERTVEWYLDHGDALPG